MWRTPPGDWDAGRIYFNAVVEPYVVASNPNVGYAGTRIVAPGMQRPWAILGIWMDCNRDGVIGMAESAVMEYRVELAPESACPATTDGVHNDGRWIREFVWIGHERNVPHPAALPKAFLDAPGARIWGDDGVPGEGVHDGCFVNPSTGAFSSTGGVVGYLDCEGSRGLVRTANGASTLLFGAPAFDDEDAPACSSDGWNVRIGLIGDDPRCPRPEAGALERGTGSPAWSVFDCASIYQVATPLGELHVPYPAPALHDARGSHYDALGATEARLFGDCTGGGTAGSLDAYYDRLNPEMRVAASSVKREPTFTFEFHGERSGGSLRRLDPETAQFAGMLSATDRMGAYPDGIAWISRTAQSTWMPIRSDLSGESPNHYTFYASVPSDLRVARGLLVPHVGVGIYGAPQCFGLVGVPVILNGWDCNPSRWWSPEHGASEMPRSTWSEEPLGVTVGHPFDLMDVDCFDNSAPELGGDCDAWRYT